MQKHKAGHRLDTPRPLTVLWELIPIEEPAPIPAVEVEEGEDDAWYIPPVMRCQMHPLNEFTTTTVEPVPEYVRIVGMIQSLVPPGTIWQ